MHLVVQDTVLIRGILDVFEREAEPVTSRLIQMTQHIGSDQANRLLKLVEKSGVIERLTATRIVLGVPTKVPCMQWQLTASAKRGEIPSAEELARGRA
jgi:hypothetical protein